MLHLLNATPNSRVNNNLRQMYAMMLVKGADVLLPDGREQALKSAEAQLEKWGDRLTEVLDNSMTDAQAEAVAEAIAKGIPLTLRDGKPNPDFPQVNPLGLNPQQDLDLINAIKSKKEDGPHFIDGLMDFAKYIKANRAGKPYRSYFNAYIDGKTNGIASNGIQMGSIETAEATGVIRKNTKQLLDRGDIRDQLKDNLLNSLDQGYDGNTDGFTTELHDVSKAVFSFRDLNKATTMTFGYGKEFSSFKKDINKTIDYLEELALSGNADAIAEHGLESFTDSMNVLRENDLPIAETILGKYVGGLAESLSSEAVDSRSLMRSAAVLHAVTNSLFSIKSPTGFDLNIGGLETLGWDQADAAEYTVKRDGKAEKVRVGQYKTEATSSAIKTRTKDGVTELDVGGEAYGGSVPAPVQSLDAATVALSTSGKSWAKLKSASEGNPYVHTIYDAFKMDANGYDVILDEVNNNWINASMKWSYLEETYKSTKETMSNFWKDINQLDPNTKIDTSIDGEHRMMGYLLDPSESKSGRWPTKLHSKLFKLISRNDNETQEQYEKRIFDKVAAISNTVRKAGYKLGSPEATVEQLKVFVRELSNHLELSGRLSSMIKRTNDKKAELNRKIKSRGPVLQYYAH